MGFRLEQLAQRGPFVVRGLLEAVLNAPVPVVAAPEIGRHFHLGQVELGPEYAEAIGLIQGVSSHAAD